MSKIITYKSKLDDAEIQTISLSTNNGLTGYRIIKFEIMATEPGAQTCENIVKIYKSDPSADGLIDFSDNNLLAAAYFENNAGAGSLPFYQFASFDREMFNQDIFITGADVNGTQPINYYLELEAIKLSDVESTMLTLQSLRTVASQ
jgi:hypothetical protein